MTAPDVYAWLDPFDEMEKLTRRVQTLTWQAAQARERGAQEVLRSVALPNFQRDLTAASVEAARGVVETRVLPFMLKHEAEYLTRQEIVGRQLSVLTAVAQPFLAHISLHGEPRLIVQEDPLHQTGMRVTYSVSVERPFDYSVVLSRPLVDARLG